MSTARTCLAVVLAAGEGQRMQSGRPKVLHEIAGRSLLEHVLASAGDAGAQAFALVVGPDRTDVAEVGRAALPDVEVFVQEQRLGTAHAVLAARAAIARGWDDLMIVFADTPLVKPATLARLREPLSSGAGVAALGFEPPDPSGYGRLIAQDGRLVAIREHKDASPIERDLRLCNAGLMAIAGRRALELLDAVDNRNAQGEYYLTDVVETACRTGLDCAIVRADADEVVGVNDRVQLAQAEALFQERLRAAAMRSGVTLIDPSSVFLSWDTRFGRDVVIEPHVVLGPGVEIAEGARINAFSHIFGARIGPAAIVGPFARLRPGAQLAENVKIGNFVEIKASSIGASAAVSHLSYVGDAVVGPRANLGAGTITCNYDGFIKQKTEIGEGAFIGSNSALVAPVQIGAGAYVGSGSVVTDDVPDDALAVGRARQIVKLGWAKAFRAKRTKTSKD